MARQAFLVMLALAALGGSVSAQVGTDETESPFEIQQPPVYLKSLTSTRENDLENKRDPEADLLVDATINRVGRSFDIGDADELEACLVTGKRKIFLSLEIGDRRQGHYGRGQVRHIFGRLFREVETRSFDSRDVELNGGGAVFRADWTYVVLDRDEVVTERLQFKLEKNEDESGWRIYEIRAASR